MVNRIRRIIRRKKRNARYRLNIFWFKKKKEFSIDNLIIITNPVYTDDFRIRKRALREFLARTDKVFEEFSRMLNAARDILEKDEPLKQGFWDQFLGIRTVDNFAELIYAGEAMAAERFTQDIKSGVIIPKQAKKVWISLFIKFTDENSRKNIWNKIKRFNPEDREIKSLFDMDGNQEIMRSLPKIAAEVRKILKQNKKIEDKRKGLLSDLRKFIDAAIKEKEAKQKQE